ncbi:transposase [Elizabethkingia ursingii]|uniref:Transposase zinc-ribbon domain-containing protein n=1 Tax=Elizabethkingia ursingii TaxID=1756150 RepID=A0ABX3N410_9FLAO|nr:transposase [Elizabethkingia ursingii]OPB84432.1 hypothetical protein BB021_16960 [Elizabethkingia ursingii]
MFKLSFKETPSEKDCIEILKSIRMEKGIICKKCKSTEFYWKSDRNEFECKRCSYRISLKVDTVMHRSRLPIHLWLITLDLILFGNSTIKDIQEFLKHKRNATIQRVYNIIKTQLSRTVPQNRPRILTYNDATIEEKIFDIKIRLLDDEDNISHQNSANWKMIRLYLEWLSQPLIDFE